MALHVGPDHGVRRRYVFSDGSQQWSPSFARAQPHHVGATLRGRDAGSAEVNVWRLTHGVTSKAGRSESSRCEMGREEEESEDGGWAPRRLDKDRLNGKVLTVSDEPPSGIGSAIADGRAELEPEWFEDSGEGRLNCGVL
jgi:hypothetical protein